MGVRRAVEIVYETVRAATRQVYTLGELIHNKQVVAELEALGVCVATELPESGVVVIRAHGVSRETKAQLQSRGVEVVDATCPHVLSSQRIIEKYSGAGGMVVILGDSEHPEVIGLCGYARSQVITVDSLSAIQAVNLPAEFLFIAQTTFSKEVFSKISKYLSAVYPRCEIVDSICTATAIRQEETWALARESDLLIVVGGKHSANTRRLAEIGEAAGCRVRHIETAAELKGESFADRCIGITAGASTPQSAIEEIQNFIISQVTP